MIDYNAVYCENIVRPSTLLSSRTHYIEPEIHLLKTYHVLQCMSGINFNSPFFTASTDFLAASLQFMNHCTLIRGSTISFERLKTTRKYHVYNSSVLNDLLLSLTNVEQTK